MGKERPALGEKHMKNANKEACHCKNVTYGQIEKAVRQGAKTPEQAVSYTHLTLPTKA